MTADEIRELLLHGQWTDENRKKIPEDARGIWFSRPIQSNIELSKSGTCIRRTLIAATILYTMIFDRFVHNETLFLFIIIGYEIAYATLRKEKNTLDNFLARERYESTVDQYLKKRYPMYQPPAE